MSVVDRPSLNRDVIATTALQLIDAQGLDRLSMRKLGAELGVEAMSLYHYVTNKSDLLDAVVDQLYREIELPEVDETDWEAAIRLGLRSFYDVLIRHEAALELFSGRRSRSRQAFDVLYWAHQRFEVVGLDTRDAHTALHFAVSFAMGHAASELGTMAQLRADDGADDDYDDPELADFFAHTNDVDSLELFETGLDILIEGLRARYQLP